MQLHIANRQKVKIKMALQGPAGSGKSFGALLIAFGLCGDWSKIAVIDSENHSSELYAHLGGFNVLNLEPPFTPERFTEAIDICTKAKMEVIILDSISAEWEGTGGILEIHGKLAGNSYTNWNKVTPRHNNFVQNMLQCPVHIIGTIRAKQDYVLTDKNGKQVPEKVGLKGITREGLDYEFTLLLELDIKQNANATKDRTSLFMGKPEFNISVETGVKIKDWCNQSTFPIRIPTNEEVLLRVNGCKSLEELLSLYNSFPDKQQALGPEFTKKRQELVLQTNSSKTISQQQNLTTNGTTVS
jgi:AAA domain